MKAATTSNVVQFSFLTSSGFRGVPRTKSTHAAQDADCWDQHGQQYRSGYQRFATIVNAVSVFSPESGTLVNRAQTRVVVHLVYSRQALLEGAYFEAGCIRALPEPCVARSRIEVNWDFELLRSPDVGPCIAPRCESIHVAAAAESKPAAERACRTYHEKHVHPRSTGKVFDSSANLGTHRLQSELVHTCTSKLCVALASFIGCNMTETIEWGDSLELPASFAVSSEEAVWIGGFPGFPYVTVLKCCLSGSHVLGGALLCANCLLLSGFWRFKST